LKSFACRASKDGDRVYSTVKKKLAGTNIVSTSVNYTSEIPLPNALHDFQEKHGA
jgi:hypothetical protein